MKTITTEGLKADSLYSRKTASIFPQLIEEEFRPHFIVAISDSASLLQQLRYERLLMVRVLRTKQPAFTGSD